MGNDLFVVLSDIHVKNNDFSDIIIRLNEFKKHILFLSKARRKKNIIILVSGDIAFSGNKSEYDLIKDFFHDLSTISKIIFCAGNHDHDFSVYSEGTLRDVLLELPIEKYDDSIISKVIEGHKSYYEFESNICNVDIVDETLLSKMYFIESDQKYSIQSLNTAWCSTLHEKGGNLKFPISQLIKNNDTNHLKITFFHHPLSWLEPNNSKELRNILRENNQIIITGHEHINDSFKVETDSSLTLMIESTTFYDNSLTDNGFITLEPSDNDLNITKHCWVENIIY